MRESVFEWTMGVERKFFETFCSSLEELKISLLRTSRKCSGSACGVERVVSVLLFFAPAPEVFWSYKEKARGELTTTNPLPTHELNSMQDYPPNLSILLSGGKETNKDGLSNGE